MIWCNQDEWYGALQEEDYQLFLEDIQEEVVIINKGSAGNTNHQEVRVGIKDWSVLSSLFSSPPSILINV